MSYRLTNVFRHQRFRRRCQIGQKKSQVCLTMHSYKWKSKLDWILVLPDVMNFNLSDVTRGAQQQSHWLFE